MLIFNLYKNLYIPLIHPMYAKLFSRIAQSSLMEQRVTTRYVFMMTLALADRHGDVIGTDVAIARMMNVPIDEFLDALKPLLEPDYDSNSQAEDGRRIISSENGRGYRVVNYTDYRDMKSDDEKREYMRDYMRKRREKLNSSNDVKSSKSCKDLSTDVTHAEADAFSKEEKNKRRVAFHAPSLSEVEEYGKTLIPKFSKAQTFIDFYESNGWKVGKNPMKNWKAAIRTWNAKEKGQPTTTAQMGLSGINSASSMGI